MSFAKLKASTFLRSVMLLAGGAAIAQGITVGVTPVLTRLFSPAEFGMLAAFTSALTILLAVSSLRYEFALPQVRNIKQARTLVFLCLGLLFVTSLLVFIFLVVASISGFALWGEWDYIWLLPVGIMFAGAFQVANYWAVREKAFRELAKANVNRSLFQATAQVGMGLAGVGGLALVLGYVLSQAVGALKILLGAVGDIRRPSWRRLRVLAVRHKRFPLFSVPAGVLNVSALHLTPFILIYFYGASSAGFFSLAQRAMGAPMAFLGMAIANVYLAELPRLKESEPERLMSFYLRSCRNLIAVGLPVVALATLILGGVST
ncbi:oligosaccharide flippase family protein [Pseudomonas lalucatii]|uniref:Oligosaccharide flippase family protein n=1 Tax=Pseudomonas lalucatii TaxID=1424203 RepID=A0ABS5PWR1_9PSED|nr:oligosaccharide flippase family protein [Pseudomonas lalucatii]